VRSGLRISIDSLISSPSAHARSIVPHRHEGIADTLPRGLDGERGIGCVGSFPDFGIGVLVGGAEGGNPFVDVLMIVGDDTMSLVPLVV